jgi:hypothetical protein
MLLDHLVGAMGAAQSMLSIMNPSYGFDCVPFDAEKSVL